MSISYHDVRIVRDLMLENRDWKVDTFQPYADERRERMRRLRMTASIFSILNAEFGPRARGRRVKFREGRARGTFIDTAPVAFIGPEAFPPEAFTEQTLDKVPAL